jgi:hypothetical protein
MLAAEDEGRRRPWTPRRVVAAALALAGPPAGIALIAVPGLDGLITSVGFFALPVAITLTAGAFAWKPDQLLVLAGGSLLAAMAGLFGLFMSAVVFISAAPTGAMATTLAVGVPLGVYVVGGVGIVRWPMASMLLWPFVALLTGLSLIPALLLARALGADWST